jgi:predicted ester cyclase
MPDFDLRAFYRRYIDMLNAREFNRIDEFVHDRVTAKGQPYTRDDVVAAWEELVDAVPDFTWQVEDQVIEGDKVAVRLLATGTPVKKWLGLGATGARVAFTELAIYKVRDGRFEQMTSLFDVQAVQDQLTFA